MVDIIHSDHTFNIVGKQNVTRMRNELLVLPQTTVYQDKHEIYVLRHRSPLCFATLLWSNQWTFLVFNDSN